MYVDGARSGILRYKTDYGDLRYSELNLNGKGSADSLISKKTLSLAYERHLQISKDKIDDLLKLRKTNIIPPSRHSYCKELAEKNKDALNLKRKAIISEKEEQPGSKKKKTIKISQSKKGLGDIMEREEHPGSNDKKKKQNTIISRSKPKKKLNKKKSA